MFEIRVRRLATAKRLRLRIDRNGSLSLTAPLLVSQKAIDKFLSDHQDWIGDKLKEVESKQKNLTADLKKILIRGRPHDLRIQIKADSKPKAQIKGQSIIVTSPREDHRLVREILEIELKKIAKDYLPERLSLLADLVDRDVGRISIRNQKSRWGSCSNRGTISLNWRLIMTPDWVSDYVIYHELAHRDHMHHREAFWNLLDSYTPKRREAESWLKKHHQLLVF